MPAALRKINLRLPEEVLAIASDQAARMGVSSNTYIVMAIRNFIPYQEKLLQRQSLPVPLSQRQGGGVVGAVSALVAKVGANQPCPCGSGEKYKRCHGKR